MTGSIKTLQNGFSLRVEYVRIHECRNKAVVSFCGNTWLSFRQGARCNESEQIRLYADCRKLIKK